jgi:hypothetical protein
MNFIINLLRSARFLFARSHLCRSRLPILDIDTPGMLFALECPGGGEHQPGTGVSRLAVQGATNSKPGQTAPQR